MNEKIKLVLLARLLFISRYYEQTGLNSFSAVEVTTSFERLYKGITGESFTDRPRYDSRETISILWELKSREILRVHLDRPWSYSYRIDRSYELDNYFDGFASLVQTLSPELQRKLILECYEYVQTRNRNPPQECKLQQPESISFLPPEDGTFENGGGQTGI